MYVCSLMSPKNLLLQQPIKKDGLFRQPIACYEIAKTTYDFVMTYMANCTINITLVMLFLVGNNVTFYALLIARCSVAQKNCIEQLYKLGSSDRFFWVDPLSYFSFQPVVHDRCKQRLWYVLSCLWDDAYKRTLAASRKE